MKLKHAYLKGAVAERKVVNIARSDGKIAFRSAGSHSPIDVCIIDKDKKIIELLQLKPKSMSTAKKQSLQNELQDLNGQFTVTFRVI